MPNETVSADATKDFFVNMFTRDIAPHDCVMDLVDNSLDGAHRSLLADGKSPQDKGQPYAGFFVELTVNPNMFRIVDNCGGIAVDLAKNNVFCFGRKPGAAGTTSHGIGLYGVGLKRAIFKLGTSSTVKSATKTEAFMIKIEVAQWLAKPEWTFDLERIPLFTPPGTDIAVSPLRPNFVQELKDATFVNALGRIIARDYSFFLAKGIKLTLNGQNVPRYPFELRSGHELQPAHYQYDDEGVRVTISAGMAALPTDDENPTEKRAADYFGWFVVCNDRVVVAADKTTKTVWGDDFQVWHQQYYGFMGLAFFEADDPSRLPWSTTKRDVDRSNAVYVRAIEKMKAATLQYIQYSNTRKGALPDARKAEQESKPVAVKELTKSETMKLPTVSSASWVTVSYSASRSDVKRIGTAMGNPSMPATRVGERTFKHYLENEL